MNRQYLLLSQALSSPHAILPSLKTEGSITRRSVSGLNGKLEDHIPEVLEGGWILDKRCVPESLLIQWVIAGPMLQDDLPPGCRLDLWDKPIACTVDDLYGKGEPEGVSMTYVSLDLYVGLWKKLGAKVYQVVNGKPKEWDI